MENNKRTFYDCEKTNLDQFNKSSLLQKENDMNEYTNILIDQTIMDLTPFLVKQKQNKRTFYDCEKTNIDQFNKSSLLYKEIDMNEYKIILLE